MVAKHIDESEECTPCSKHSGIETWVKIGMAGIALNICLLSVNIILNLTLNVTVASIKTSMESHERRLAIVEGILFKVPK